MQLTSLTPGPDTPGLPDPLPPDDPAPIPEPDPAPLPRPGVAPRSDPANGGRRAVRVRHSRARGARARYLAWVDGPDHRPAA